jgi:hypothetical protein
MGVRGRVVAAARGRVVIATERATGVAITRS